MDMSVKLRKYFNMISFQISNVIQMGNEKLTSCELHLSFDIILYIHIILDITGQLSTYLKWVIRDILL